MPVTVLDARDWRIASTGRQGLTGPELTDDELVEEQIRAATAANLTAHTSVGHEEHPLYTFIEDCEHVDPDEDPIYAPLMELRADWFQSHGGDQSRFESYLDFLATWNAHPLAAEYKAAADAYGDVHPGRICTESFVGHFCAECTDGDDDSGYEDAPCLREFNAREALTEFFAINGSAVCRTPTKAIAA